MAIPVRVDDPADPRLTDYFDLTDVELRRRVEGEAGLFIAEGEQVVRRLLASSHRVRSILVTPSRFARMRDVLDVADTAVYVAPREVLEGVVGFHLHRGVVASGARLPEGDVDTLLATARTVAVLEGLNDHENLGAVFRSAHALGVDAVLLDPTCADPYYRRSVRVSMGAVLVVPFARLPGWPGSLQRVRDLGFRIIALAPAGESVIEEVRPRAGERCAVLLGAEGSGLSAGALAAADVVARIPMRPGVDSLNVGHAAAVAFHRLVAPESSA